LLDPLADWLDRQPPGRRRLYVVFLAIILLALPCYALGGLLLWFNTPPTTPQAVPTAGVASVTPAPSDTIEPGIPTRAPRPTEPPTRPVIPTAVPTLASPTVLPSETATAVATPTPTAAPTTAVPPTATPPLPPTATAIPPTVPPTDTPAPPPTGTTAPPTPSGPPPFVTDTPGSR